MANIDYIQTDASEIDAIKPLWEQLVRHHKARSTNFKDIYDRFTFEKRKADLLNKSREGYLRIDLAKDRDTDLYIGYCVSTLNHGNEGEIDSIFIEQAYRSTGIGSVFMERALAWMDDHHVEVKRVAVAVGNESAFGFYSKYGFLPRQVLLEQKK